VPLFEFGDFICLKCDEHPVFHESTKTWLCRCTSILDESNEDIPAMWHFVIDLEEDN